MGYFRARHPALDAARLMFGANGNTRTKISRFRA
jgi:hypothetical protein